jgi:hypothetical protein
MHIFRHIFLSNYWWQRSDIWSQASYRYPISWEAFLDPSDSWYTCHYFWIHIPNFALMLVLHMNSSIDDVVASRTVDQVFIHIEQMHIFRHIFLSNYWWQRPIRFLLPVCRRAGVSLALAHSSSYFKHGVPIWCLWPNIRFLPSSYWEKCDEKYLGRTDRGKTVYPPPSLGSGGIIKYNGLICRYSYIEKQACFAASANKYYVYRQCSMLVYCVKKFKTSSK